MGQKIMTSNEFSDPSAILRRIKAGDRQALDRLFRRYADRLLRIIRAKLNQELRRKIDSMDVLQEVYIQAASHIGNFEPQRRGTLLHWLSVIIGNKIRDLHDHFHAAKRNFYVEVPLDKKESAGSRDVEKISTLAGPDKTPSQNLLIAEEILKFQKALDTLSPQQKEIIVLKLQENLTFEQIGTLKGRQPESMRKAYSRAMARLTLTMEQLDVTPER